MPHSSHHILKSLSAWADACPTHCNLQASEQFVAHADHAESTCYFALGKSRVLSTHAHVKELKGYLQIVPAVLDSVVNAGSSPFLKKSGDMMWTLTGRYHGPHTEEFR